MMEAGWSAGRVACQLGHSDCVEKSCWDQWIREMSFTRKPVSGQSRQTSCREDHDIVKNARVQPTASLATIQAQVAPSMGHLCLFEPYDGDWLKEIWDYGAHYAGCS
ncbi:uncharacterized protein TNCV_4756431 [Trichonephila clavipes]|nr:uncharacterized protein TNCV_4756431 [Trichonephila clavipes]